MDFVAYGLRPLLGLGLPVPMALCDVDNDEGEVLVSRGGVRKFLE